MKNLKELKGTEMTLLEMDNLFSNEGCKMEFAKYYNATNIVKKLMDEEKISADWNQYSNGVYVCMDTHDFWICRILEGYNDEYEQEEGSWLLERNKIDQYDLIDFIADKTGEKLKYDNRRERDSILDCLKDNFILKYVIMYDDNQGFENWDIYQENSLEDCIELLDDGYGIIEVG